MNEHSGFEVEPPVAIKPLPKGTQIIQNEDGTVTVVPPKEDNHE